MACVQADVGTAADGTCIRVPEQVPGAPAFSGQFDDGRRWTLYFKVTLMSRLFVGHLTIHDDPPQHRTLTTTWTQNQLPELEREFCRDPLTWLMVRLI